MWYIPGISVTTDGKIMTIWIVHLFPNGPYIFVQQGKSHHTATLAQNALKIHYYAMRNANLALRAEPWPYQ